MGKIKHLSILFGLIIGVLPVLTASASDTRFYKGILWEVKTEGADSSYIFGTFHSDDEAILELPVRVRKALYFSSVLVLEMPINADSAGAMQKAALLPEDHSLRHVINDNLIYTEAVATMAQRGSPRTITSRLKPWAVYMSLNSPQKKSGISQDFLLQMLAGAQGKPIAGLERVHEQIAVYDGLTIHEQVALLESLLEDHGTADAEYELIKQHYLERNLLKLAQAASTENLAVADNLQEKVQRRLVENRNDVMVDRMLPYLDDGDAFIAVGALHLPGENGILQQLSQSGYQVTPIY